MNKKRLFALILSGLLSASSTMAVQAWCIVDITPRGDTDVSAEVSAAASQNTDDNERPVPNYANFMPAASDTESGVNGHFPTDVTVTEENGRLRVAKTFLVDAGVTPDVLTESALFRSGVKLTLTDVSAKELPGAASGKTVTEEKTSQGKSQTAAKSALPATIPYDRDGFTGTFALVEDSVAYEAQGENTYAVQVREKKEYRRISRNDPVLLDKVLEKNGVQLGLQSVEWTDVGVGDGSVAGPFDAVAVYTGTASGTKAESYKATGRYQGEVTAQAAGQVEYTLLYEGIAPKTSVPTEITPAAAVEKANELFPAGKILSWVAGVLAVLAVGAGGAVLLRKRKTAREFAVSEDGFREEAPERMHQTEYASRACMDRPSVLDAMKRRKDEE